MNTPSNRRRFMQQTAALGLGVVLPGSRPTRSRPVKSTVGHGDFVYEPDHKWGNLDPSKHPLQHCHEMVLDSRGRLVCSSVSNQHDVLVYSKDGKLLNAWNNGLPEPHGLSSAGEGSDQTLWITDVTDGRVLNLDLDGRIIRELEAPPEDLLDGKTYKPTETTVARNGDIFVTDGYGSNKIFRYNSRGQLQHSFGGSEHFDCSHGIALDQRGGGQPTLLITSRAGNNFQRWSLAGDHLQTYELPGLHICRPVIDGDQTYFAVIVTKNWWFYDGMVAVLDKDMKVVSLPGGSAPRDQADFTGVEYDNQTFLNPHDVCVDEDKNVYVPQWFSGRTYPVRLRRV